MIYDGRRADADGATSAVVTLAQRMQSQKRGARSPPLGVVSTRVRRITPAIVFPGFGAMVEIASPAAREL